VSGSPSPKVKWCSLCGAPLVEADSVTRETSLVGRFCGVTCAQAMTAIDSVREIEDDETADALLAAYRRGVGPPPTLVLEAVERVSRHAAGVGCVRVACA
jgi:hypothetical protein